MIRPTKIPKFQSLSEAVDERYIQNLEFPVDENLMNETQAYMKASIFEFVGAEKIMKKLRYVMQRSHFHSLARSVDGDSSSSPICIFAATVKI